MKDRVALVKTAMTGRAPIHTAVLAECGPRLMAGMRISSVERQVRSLGAFCQAMTADLVAEQGIPNLGSSESKM